MQFKALNDNAIEIELTGDELQALDITYDELDYANIETRRVLWTVLDEAREALGRDINLSGKMLIEAQSDGSGGCILDFTLLGDEPNSPRKLIKKEPQPLLLETEDSDSVLMAAKACPAGGSSALYRNGGHYRLLVRCSTPERDAVLGTLSEFGTVLPDTTGLLTASTQELWTLICENAVEKISG